MTDSEKLSEILADKNEHYSITVTEQTISIYYYKCRLFEVILDEINEFIQHKHVIDIKFTLCLDSNDHNIYSALIMYEDIK